MAPPTVYPHFFITSSILLEHLLHFTLTFTHGAPSGLHLSFYPFHVHRICFSSESCDNTTMMAPSKPKPCLCLSEKIAHHVNLLTCAGTDDIYETMPLNENVKSSFLWGDKEKYQSDRMVWYFLASLFTMSCRIPDLRLETVNLISAVQFELSFFLTELLILLPETGCSL